ATLQEGQFGDPGETDAKARAALEPIPGELTEIAKMLRDLDPSTRESLANDLLPIVVLVPDAFRTEKMPTVSKAALEQIKVIKNLVGLQGEYLQRDYIFPYEGSDESLTEAVIAVLDTAIEIARAREHSSPRGDTHDKKVHERVDRTVHMLQEPSAPKSGLF